ncbi:MAG: hypothetical protein Q4B28_04205 [bacterium]|nr:hypothetical protein [bacterium]
MKTKLLMASSFLAVAGIAVVSYATGLHSGQNYLNADQVNFKPLYSSHHQRQLKDVAMWDTMLTKISTWVENHESRLQARASSSAEYPNLSAEETSFRHLIQARENNGNKLTEQMWDSLQTQLSKVALNHEMRLRMQASQSTQPSDPIRPQLFIVNKDALTATSTDYQSDPAGRIEMQVKIFPAGNYTVQYSSSDINVVYPLGWATAPQNTTDFSNTFAATNYGEARICAFIMHNGQKIQDCAKARVVDPNAGGNSAGGNTDENSPNIPFQCNTHGLLLFDRVDDPLSFNNV